ncbi:hypothetical protein O181_003830 [Austropuccinia psidii MF-1]|uniref:Reverse transcriptase Ty1/copia-type domain-containing protein n=1 Tax=Austropuccinia psidii MF-1 TaxID=1389203 RepID=A0A9Q3BFS4_9BASI|nr:hypothetical protein [Austropuccinia psidii MF-1]
MNYWRALGLLNYIISTIRPDIPLSITVLSQFMDSPSILNWKACLKVSRYLNHTRHLSLQYQHQDSDQIIRYSNSDWRNHQIDQGSVSGYTVSISHHLFSCNSKKQKTVFHSTMEAEYKALSDSAKETIWLINPCKEINLPLQGQPIILNEDKGTIDLALIQANHRSLKTKHMDINLHSIGENLNNKTINLHHVSSQKIDSQFSHKGSR